MMPSKNRRNRRKKNLSKDVAICNPNRQADVLPRLPPKCSICSDKICFDCDNTKSFVLPCGHLFAEVCIDAWIFVNRRCPTCYSRVDHDFVFQPHYTRRRTFAEKITYDKAVDNAKVKIGLSGIVAGDVVAGGEVASEIMKRAANAASTFITRGTTERIQRQIDNIRSNDEMVTERERHQIIQNVKTVKVVSSVAATVTGCVANVVGTSLGALGSLCGPVLKSAGSNLLVNEFDMDKKKADDMVEGAMGIAKAAFISAGNVVRGVEYASKMIASSAASNIARLYEIENGMQPGDLESDVEDIARNAVSTAWNIRALPPTSFAKISRAVVNENSLKKFENLK